MASSYALCHICYFWIFLRHFSLCWRKMNEYRYYIIQKDIYMYTYMFICIYIKQKNTVCHIWFVCNTFSGCLKLGVSRNTHMQCFWSCLPWTVACSLRKDVTSTFVTYCLNSPHWVQEQWETTAPDTLSPHMHTAMYLLLILTALLLNDLFRCNTQWHVPFLLFLQNWMSIPHWKKWDKMIYET